MDNFIKNTLFYGTTASTNGSFESIEMEHKFAFATFVIVEGLGNSFVMESLAILRKG